ncbi:hypothetical protein AKO1_004360 [Acrasis kona]|uniref:MBTPS1 fourth domain-containing protein n=1 Tax=Acrasis kona TaxID=1008807 RepID=A0AAW2Z744_9EUKA
MEIPMRKSRILWSQFHNIQYPMGYIPRDNLNFKDNILDWTGDSLHTNFKSLFEHLIKRGYHVEILTSDLTKFDARLYGTLMLVDTEEEFTEEERVKLHNDVEKGLGVVVLADWYNTEVMRSVRFFDDNTKTHWHPLTGGCNIPALNALLDSFGVVIGDRIYDGEITATVVGSGDAVNQREVVRATFGTGAGLFKFPKGATIVKFPLRDRTAEFSKQNMNSAQQQVDAPVLGFLQYGLGRLAVFGDSNCVDDVNSPMMCMWLVDHMLKFTTQGSDPDTVLFAKQEVLTEGFVMSQAKLPERTPGVVVSSRVPLQELIHARPLYNVSRYIGRSPSSEGWSAAGHQDDMELSVQGGSAFWKVRLMVPVGLMVVVFAYIVYMMMSRGTVLKMTRDSRMRV